MKKFLLLLFFIITLVVPFNVKADAVITGNNEVTVGDSFSLEFRYSYYFMVNSNTSPTIRGIWLAGFELVYDENIFSITSVSSLIFDTIVLEEDNKYFVFSKVGEDAGNCAFNMLYCGGSYTVTIDFFVKSTNVTNTTIKMKDVEFGSLDINKSEKPSNLYDLIDNLIISPQNVETSHNITIKQPETQKVIEAPKDITTTSKPDVTLKQATQNTTIKSDNAYLKSLTIDNYNITFNREKIEYTIYVDETVNELTVNAAADHNKASFVINGANDLSASNNTVTVIVTAENGAKKTYTINVKVKDKEQNEITEEPSIDSEYNPFKFDKNMIFIGIGIVSIVILIVIIIIIISKFRDRKINKLLKNL